MFKKATYLVITFLTLSIILAACGSKATPTPTTNPDAVYTAAAQTADARLTEFFQSTPSPLPATPTPTFDFTQTAVAQTATAQAASALLTQMAALTLTPLATLTSTPAPTVLSGDRATYVSDVTIPDGTDLAPGAAFVKTWKFQNTGTTTWSTSYSLVFISGDQMGTVTSVPLPESVAPGQQVNVSVNMVAPTTTGTYRGFWEMKNAAGQLFAESVYVLIDVVSGGATATTAPGVTPTPTSTGAPGNLITNLSMAVDPPSWLGCPHTFTFAASFTLNQGATLTYVLEAGSETPGFQFNLPGPQTSTFFAGTYSLTFPLEFTSSGIGWVRIHFTAPVDITSNQAAFNLTCTR